MFVLTTPCVLPQLKRIVSRLRKQRAGMVQTPDQYMFCYQALKVVKFQILVKFAQSPAEIHSANHVSIL